MFEITRIKTTIKPEKVESLGNGIWYYNYDIKESIEPGQEGQDEIVYDFVQVRISGTPDYDKCTKAIIRAYVNSDSEFDLMNSFNAYQLGITDSAGEDYEKYLQLLQEIKEKVGKDFNRQADIAKSYTPRQADITKVLLMTINTMSLTDQQALSVKSLYPSWGEFIGKELAKDTKVQYEDKLFKVVQTHTAQVGWEPGIATASLFTQIVEDHEGTLDDPIPYPSDGNIVIYNGKYYIENGITYKCVRDSGIPLYTALANVVGNYVQKV